MGHHQPAQSALIFSILADFAAGFPTLLKAAKHPETESWRAYLLSTVGFIISALAIHELNFANYGFVMYLVVMNGALSLLASRRTGTGRA